MADPTERPTRETDMTYPPAAVGLDPVTLPPALEAAGPDAPTFQEAISPKNLTPNDGVAARDAFYYGKPATGSFRDKHFGRFTWAMIVVAGIVLGASVAMMAAGA